MTKIKKIEITNSVYYVEIADADLFILCGCPADSVKHLMKKGLITTVEENGVKYETGPNAILLSDILMQHGEFSNLAEFPSMQMLYRQGMIIPGHPGNTGTKPMLIGSPGQINSQMHYIYRGNYGLISREEIIMTGVDKKSAENMMEMKLQFAFGKILHTRELFDTINVENESVEIKNRVMIKRKALNIFELSYDGESVIIDLNLQPGEKYELPYLLSYHDVKREYFAIVHSGNGDGWNINHPCMASILIFQGKIYLIDAGPNISGSLTALGISINEVEGIFHTHAHDDHFAGLLTLMRGDHKIKYFSTPLVRSSVNRKLSALLSIDEEKFSDYFEIHDLEFDVWNDIDGLEVKPILSPHPVENNIFIFRALWENGYRSYAHFADIVDLNLLKKMIKDNESGRGISREFFDKTRDNYLFPADLKKIDAGGGLIHGKAKNFSADPSEKIVLSHMSEEPNDEDKVIGSGAPFGVVDILIPSFQDFVRKYSSALLASYFTTVPMHQLKILLNNEVVSFNPESIILKKGERSRKIYLILTGNVEALRPEEGVHVVLSAGAMIGEITGIEKMPSKATYRAAGFVKALKISSDLYLEFIKHNNLYKNIQELQERRNFIKKTAIFGEIISYPVQNRVAESLRLVTFAKGDKISMEDSEELFIVSKGKLELFIGKDVFETLNPGDFFGEESSFFRRPAIYHVRVCEPSDVYKISGNVLKEIPIVRLKVLEVFERRLKLLLDSELNNTSPFQWRDEYSVNINRFDNHHRQLFQMTNELYKAVDSKKEKKVIETVFRFLIEYSEYHFKYEEEVMTQYKFPELEQHKQRHKQLLNQVIKLKEGFKSRDIEIDTELIEFLKSWIIDHILDEDRKYTPFLNEKGVF